MRDPKNASQQPGASHAEHLNTEAEKLAARLPDLLVEADRVAHTVAQGLHGRRRAGPGEAFWQFRRYRPGDQPNMIDWRKSARRQTYLIREREWEAANTVWLWADRSGSMHFKSDLANTTKVDRAILLELALAHLLTQAGERIGPLGSGVSASAGPNAVRRIAEYVSHSISREQSHDSLPPMQELSRFSHVVVFSDFLEPVADINAALAGIAARDVGGHLVQVLDPAEEAFLYTGRTEFESVTGGLRLTVGRAESLRDDYRKRLTEHNDRLRELARRLGWSFTTHHTDQSPHTVLLALNGLMSGHPLSFVGETGIPSDEENLAGVPT